MKLLTEITQVVEAIWQSHLGLPIQLAADQGSLAAGHAGGGQGYVTAFVILAGESEGAVVVSTSATLARRVATIMFGRAPSDVTTEEIRDAVGELANVAGGNLKAVLPEPSRLSLPTVTLHDDPEGPLPDGLVCTRARFVCEGEPVVIRLLEQIGSRGLRKE